MRRRQRGVGRTPEGVDQRVLLDGGLVQQRGDQGGVGGHAVEAAVEDRLAGWFTGGGVKEERLRAGGRVPLGVTRLQGPAGGDGG